MGGCLVKFLIKIEDAINSIILSFVAKVKGITPQFIFKWVALFKSSPAHILQKIKSYSPKLRLLQLKTIGYLKHYSTMISGHIVGIQIYLRSEEFKKRDKKELIIAPLRKFKTDPIKAFSVITFSSFILFATVGIYKNTAKIIIGTKALRAPAAVHEEDPILEFKKIKYKVMNDKELVLDITVVAKSLEERDKLIHIEKDIERLISEMTIIIAQLPPTKEEIKTIEKQILKMIEGAKIKTVEVRQVLNARPTYFQQTEKMVSFKDLNLQLFLEDTKRNRQIWVDFTVLASNRNIIFFLKDHEIEVRDFINMQVEPVIPQLPIEEEGRQIIKEKLRIELNDYIKKSGIEGKILEIYVDYIIVS